MIFLTNKQYKAIMDRIDSLDKKIDREILSMEKKIDIVNKNTLLCTYQSCGILGFGGITEQYKLSEIVSKILNHLNLTVTKTRATEETINLVTKIEGKININSRKGKK